MPNARGPAILRGAFVTIDPTATAPQVIGFTYNPATLKRTLQPQMAGGEQGDRSEAVRFTGAPTQTITIDVELDATDLLGSGDAVAAELGAMPQLAALELLAYPSLSQVSAAQAQLASGTMEISPMAAPRTLFVWGDKRVLPVRITSYDIAEQLFDTRLNPLSATVTIAMRVLTYSDLDAGNREYFEFMAYQQNLATAAARAPSRTPDIGVDPRSL